jgi:hypothetical protein
VNRKTSEDPAVFGDIAYAESGDLIGLAADQLLSVEQDAALGRANDAHDAFQCRRFADPVPPEEADQFSLSQFKRHPMQNVAFSIIAVDALDLQHGYSSPK